MKLKNRIIPVLFVLLVISFAAAFIPFGQSTVSATGESVFTMKGAAVRSEEPTGLRFTAEISNDDYNESYTYGMLLLPKTELPDDKTANDLTMENASTLNAMNVVVGADNNGIPVSMVNGESYKSLNVVLKNIPTQNYGTAVIARAYYNDGTETVYSEYIERSIAQVASVAKQNGETYEILDGYIDAAVEKFAQSETEIKLIPAQNKNLNVDYVGAENLAIIYESNNDCVTVDKEGNIKGVSVDSATVTAKLGSKTLTYTVSVEKPTMTADAESIDINTVKTLSGKDNAVDSVKTFGFKIYDADGNPVDNVDKAQLSLSSNNRQIEINAETFEFTAKPQEKETTDMPPYSITASYYGAECSSVVNVANAINCKEDMDVLGKMAQNAEAHLWGASFVYKLITDIDYNGQAITPIAALGFGCTWNESYGNLNPVDLAFAATFDGNGRTIKNALICNIVSSSDGTFPGSCVFGNLTGTVKNLCFDGIKFEKEDNGYVNHSGIVCQNSGTLENILVLNASINSSCSTYESNWATSAILVAQNGGTVRNCIVSASYTTGVAPSGLTRIVYGTNSGTIENVYAINTENQGWCTYCPSGDDGKKYVSAAALNEAHPEMFADTAFTFNAESGTITLK